MNPGFFVFFFKKRENVVTYTKRNWHATLLWKMHYLILFDNLNTLKLKSRKRLRGTDVVANFHAI